jgi:hypothetical protein
MKRNLDEKEEKKQEKFIIISELHQKLIPIIDKHEHFEESKSILRQMIEVIIWGDQNKCPFIVVIFIRNL